MNTALIVRNAENLEYAKDSVGLVINASDGKQCATSSRRATVVRTGITSGRRPGVASLAVPSNRGDGDDL